MRWHLYGHLLPGAHDEAAGLLDAFLARQVGDAEVERTVDATLRGRLRIRLEILQATHDRAVLVGRLEDLFGDVDGDLDLLLAHLR